VGSKIATAFNAHYMNTLYVDEVFSGIKDMQTLSAGRPRH
jgi:hypothetical protein